MKRCPKCSKTYDDASLNFCLADGSPLVEMGSEPTVVIPRPAANKSGKLLLWLGVGVLVIGLGVVGLAAILLYQLSGKGDTVAGSSQNTERRTGSNTTRPKPTSSPTPTVESENTDSENDAAQPPEESQEVTPMGWDTTAGGFKGEPGRTYTFQCPNGGTEHGIYGSDVYTDYSSICTAAAHVGVIDVQNGGVVTIEYRPGRQIYGSTERNTVKSNTAGEYSRSFVIKNSEPTPKS